jgi:hypothetical protein
MNTKAHSKLTFDQFAELAGTQATRHLRRGQAMMALLCDFSNEIYSAVVDYAPENVDPFYQDEKIPAFLKYLLANHVELPVESAPLALRPASIKVGQFYRSNKTRFEDVLYIGAQTCEDEKILVVVSTNSDQRGYVVGDPEPAGSACVNYWDSFYEVPAPTFK